MNKLNNQLGTQQKIQSLRDDPVAAGHLVKYQSYLNRVNNFEKNGLTLSDQFQYREGYMSNSLEIMQRVRELAVTGANGIYNQDIGSNVILLEVGGNENVSFEVKNTLDAISEVIKEILYE